ncbi:hypothetical protein EAO73_28060 [Streptomyces sp. col6]|uniref:hypothetical protein n=1 Tax=Streptomyces sp. col6 TaxID=2478958 RepID=UPI0011CDD263|nr:hypothetical protein [Streptomyces sp. col6]TXR99781.1 hypothetical protein EAO73_28060 [Streptomyces sp. col6]
MHHPGCRSVPIPEDVADLRARLRERPDVLADDAPLASLRIVAALEPTITEVCAVAAHTAQADTSWDTIPTGLDLPELEPVRGSTATHAARDAMP